MVGAGPAGRAVAARAATTGLDVALIDPDPQRPWTATYGAWADELPRWLPRSVVATEVAGVAAYARTAHSLDRRYVVLSTATLQQALSPPAGVRPVAASAVGLRRDGSHTAVLLRGGGEVGTRVVIDASGARRVLGGGPPPGVRAVQTAVGVMVPTAAGSGCWFMDWRQDHGDRGEPSFLYAVPLEGQRMLWEETCLARRPAMTLEVLERRLRRRLVARGVAVPDDAPTERVAFAVDTPLTTGKGPVVTFGAAAPLIHPATGYSVAAALRLADPLVTTVAGRLADPVAAAAAARQVVWSRPARWVHRLRRRGLEAVLALPPEGVVDFFELFFSLPATHQRAYLSEREDLPAVAKAMAAVFAAADWQLRRHLLRWGAGPDVHVEASTS